MAAAELDNNTENQAILSVRIDGAGRYVGRFELINRHGTINIQAHYLPHPPDQPNRPGVMVAPIILGLSGRS